MESWLLSTFLMTNLVHTPECIFHVKCPLNIVTVAISREGGNFNMEIDHPKSPPWKTYEKTVLWSHSLQLKVSVALFKSLTYGQNS